jgi:hypothetical protein
VTVEREVRFNPDEVLIPADSLGNEGEWYSNVPNSALQIAKAKETEPIPANEPSPNTDSVPDSNPYPPPAIRLPLFASRYSPSGWT